MATTPTYALRYQTLADPPNGATLGQNLALDVEAQISRLDSVITGQPTTSDREDGLYTTTSTTYTTAATTGTANICGVTFVAPPSGRSMIVWAAEIYNNTSTQTTYVSLAIRTGSTIGSGTTILAASDAVTNSDGGATPAAQRSSTYVAEGLTPGSTYNVRLEHRVAGGTGQIQYRRVSVVPVR